VSLVAGFMLRAGNMMMMMMMMMMSTAADVGRHAQEIQHAKRHGAT
jgi:hypothetical protein